MPDTFDATVFYAVGDIHGLADQLSALHTEIFNHHDAHHAGAPACIVHLGDYVDRGANSRGVIEAIYEVHSYYEPVITVTDVLRSLCKGLDDSINPHRWWNKDGDWKAD